MVYYIFDLLYLDGHDLKKLPLERRKALLGKFSLHFPTSCSVITSKHKEQIYSDSFPKRDLRGLSRKMPLVPISKAAEAFTGGRLKRNAVRKQLSEDLQKAVEVELISVRFYSASMKGIDWFILGMLVAVLMKKALGN